MSIYGSPVALLNFQLAHKIILLMSSGCKKEEPRYTWLSEARVSHSQRMRTEVSSSVPHLLRNGLSNSPSRRRCLLRVLCPMRRPVITLDCIMLKDRSLAYCNNRRSIAESSKWKHQLDTTILSILCHLISSLYMFRVLQHPPIIRSSNVHSGTVQPVTV